MITEELNDLMKNNRVKHMMDYYSKLWDRRTLILKYTKDVFDCEDEGFVLLALGHHIIFTKEQLNKELDLRDPIIIRELKLEKIIESI